jgi:3-hydroxyacyl-CoA dehydrogenase
MLYPPSRFRRKSKALSEKSYHLKTKFFLMETLLAEPHTKSEVKTASRRNIRKVTVLGSGIMGSRIALHFANIGAEVLLLDMVPKELNDAEKARGVKEDSKTFRNRIVNDSFQNTLKANPGPVYDKKFTDRIKLGNFDDNLKEISDYDWVIEVVVERLDVKKSIFEKVDQFRKKGTLVTSNTSGIPIHLMAEGRSEDFQKHFCGTHFFNPPRYLRLLEVIPTPQTDKSVIDFLMKYGDVFLGKTTVLCKDTPAFIANRVGVYAMMSVIKATTELDLTIEEVDRITGEIAGKPKSGTFRLSDVVGLDTTVNVANNLFNNLANDESKDTFQLPAVVQKLSENKWLGDKTNQGFYKKTKNDKGETEILSLDLKTFEYRPAMKVKMATLDATKGVDKRNDRLRILVDGKDKAAEFYRKTTFDLFRYVTFRIPEISDELYRIDQAICAGFGWQIGPFETWDVLGIRDVLTRMEAEGYKPAAWVQEMLAAGHETFYKVEGGVRKYYDIPTKTYKAIPGTEEFLLLENLKSAGKIRWSNAGSNIIDLGDGILGFEWFTKMNTLGAEVLEGMNKALNLAEKEYQGLVLGGETENFSAGANLAMLYMFAIEEEWDEVEMMTRQFQNAIMRLRYSSIPVVAAPYGLTLGGGTEILLHSDHIQAHAESYIGLVEVGVGIIPGGGGTKEMALRASDSYEQGDVELNILQNLYMNIATAKVTTSAHEAYETKVMRRGDKVTLNRSRLLADAKFEALEMAQNGYTQPKMRNDIKVQGKTGIALFKAGVNAMKLGRYISAHDQKIAEKLAYVICGGDLSYPQMVSEQYLLDLEREAFLSLCGERKTLERMQSLLSGGKPLRN